MVALAEPPLALLPANDRGARFGGLARLFGRALGAHGYDPARYPEMHGIFVALGRGVPKGARLPRVRAIDVAPTVAKLLGIEPPAQSEGERDRRAHAFGFRRRHRRHHLLADPEALAGVEAAVHGDRAAAHERGVVGGEEERDVRHLFGLAEPAERVRLLDPLRDRRRSSGRRARSSSASG